MSAEIAIALAQANPVAPDPADTLARLRRMRAEAAARGADLVVFPELFLASDEPLECLAAETADGGPTILVGAPWRAPDGSPFSAAFLLHGGAVAGKALRHAPDERGILASGPVPGPIRLPLREGAVRLGVMLGADMAGEDVAEAASECGAELLVVLAGSPFARDAAERRLQQGVTRVTETGLPLLYVNAVGGADGIVADGGSFVLAADRRLVLQAPWFAEAVTLCRWRHDGDGGWSPASRGPIAPPLPELEALWRALVLGLRDQARKRGREAALLELSDEPDATLLAAVAVEALGVERVRAVAGAGSAELAGRLGIRLDALDTAPAMAALQRALEPLLGERPAGGIEAKLRPGLRDLALATLAEGLGALLLATEDGGSGFPVLRGLDPLDRQALLRWRNAGCAEPMPAHPNKQPST
ncbi:nitrilase-related carbon-nitrogen hydrolase [Benzoatithermus flavus]|uniref:Nitrilase-related carbon-nitrogen hydrolase n=1 Tax=Benzoatithermus flavus TaxID=3108223 RepID=A0ABU8XRB4_9PROT